MKEKFILLAILVFLSLLEATVFSSHLVLILILSLGVIRIVRAGLIWAMIGGLICDLILGNTLGFSSLFFLVAIFLLNLYKSKFKATNLVYLLPFTLLTSSAYGFFRGEPFNFFNLLITTLFLFMIFPVLNFYLGAEDKNLQLPLKI